MRELISRKERKEMIIRHLANNPNESSRSVAGRFGVSHRTILNHKVELSTRFDEFCQKESGNFFPQKGQKVEKSFHLKPNQLAVNGLPLGPSEIRARFNQICQEMAIIEDQATKLSECLSFQLVDVLQDNANFGALPYHYQLSEKIYLFFKGLMDEQPNR